VLASPFVFMFAELRTANVVRRTEPEHEPSTEKREV